LILSGDAVIRRAKFADVMAIVRLLQWACANSHYGGTVTDVDVDWTKKLIQNAISRHGQTNGGACFVQVIEEGGAICGLILGTLQRVYGIGTTLMATDMFWIVDENAKPFESLALVAGMIDWAWSCPAVVDVKIGTTAIMGRDPEVAGRLLMRSFGMERYGAMWRLERPAAMEKVV
jgi:hypothetical protein